MVQVGPSWLSLPAARANEKSVESSWIHFSFFVSEKAFWIKSRYTSGRIDNGFVEI